MWIFELLALGFGYNLGINPCDVIELLEAELQQLQHPLQSVSHQSRHVSAPIF